MANIRLSALRAPEHSNHSQAFPALSAAGSKNFAAAFGGLTSAITNFTGSL